MAGLHNTTRVLASGESDQFRTKEDVAKLICCKLSLIQIQYEGSHHVRRRRRETNIRNPSAEWSLKNGRMWSGPVGRGAFDDSHEAAVYGDG